MLARLVMMKMEVVMVTGVVIYIYRVNRTLRTKESLLGLSG